MRIKYLLIFLLCTVVISMFRFGHTLQDSESYIAFAKYFDGQARIEEVGSSFIHRPLIPYVVSLMPFEGHYEIKFAALSVLCTVLAYFIFYLFLRERFKNNETSIMCGMLFLVFSFPTFNYSSSVMTDAAGFLFFILGAYLLSKYEYMWFSLMTCFGVMCRETTLFLLPVYAITVYKRSLHKGETKWDLLGLIPPVLIFFAIRSIFRSEFEWYPHWQTLINNLTRPVSWATVLLTIVPVGWLFLSRFFFMRETLHFDTITKALLIGTSMLFLYSLTSAYMSGRFIWYLYIPLISLISQPIENNCDYCDLLRKP